MTEDDYIAQRQKQVQAIQNNPSLTTAQKNEQTIDLSNQPMPEPPYLLYALVGSGGIGLLIGLLKWEQGRKPKAAPKTPPINIEDPKKIEEPAKKKPKKNSKKATIYNDPLPVPKVNVAPVQTAEPPMPDVIEKVHIPISQEEVDDLPEEELGMSFFTSRPIPQAALVEVTILVGGLARIVRSTKEEAIECRIGNTPKVRAFIIDEQPVPWYDIPQYDPYDHYWLMIEGYWLPAGEEVTASFIKTVDLDPNMTGYYGVPMVENILEADDVHTEGSHEYDSPRGYESSRYSRPKGSKGTDSGDPFIVRRRREVTPHRLARSIARGAWFAAARAFHQMPGSDELGAVEEHDTVPETEIRASRQRIKISMSMRFNGRPGLHFKRRTPRERVVEMAQDTSYLDI